MMRSNDQHKESLDKSHTVKITVKLHLMKEHYLTQEDISKLNERFRIMLAQEVFKKMMMSQFDPNTIIFGEIPQEIYDSHPELQ